MRELTVYVTHTVVTEENYTILVPNKWNKKDDDADKLQDWMDNDRKRVKFTLEQSEETEETFEVSDWDLGEDDV